MTVTLSHLSCDSDTETCAVVMSVLQPVTLHKAAVFKME